MNYEILNYLGEQLIPSVSEEQLALMKEDVQLNVFEWDATEESNILVGFAKAINEHQGFKYEN